MNGLIEIKEISSIETYSVRHPVLREGRPIEDCKFEGDDLESTFHLGLFYENILVGVASFMKNNLDLFLDEHQYQLRGMAVLKAYQGKQLGDALFKYGETLLVSKNVTLTWFNAREIAVNFYKRNGCHIIGQPFEIKDIGTHYVMFKKI
jgi:GNAT superfamily N-acetyltransferase